MLSRMLLGGLLRLRPAGQLLSHGGDLLRPAFLSPTTYSRTLASLHSSSLSPVIYTKRNYGSEKKNHQEEHFKEEDEGKGKWPHEFIHILFRRFKNGCHFIVTGISLLFTLLSMAERQRRKELTVRLKDLTQHISSIIQHFHSLTEEFNSITVTEEFNSLTENYITEQVNSIIEQAKSITEQVNSISEQVNSISEKWNSITDNSITEQLNSIIEKLNSIIEQLNSITEQLNSIIEQLRLGLDPAPGPALDDGFDPASGSALDDGFDPAPGPVPASGRC